MCGIFASLSDKSIDDVKPYFEKLRHRGPDASYIDIIDPDMKLIFGFHRLSIVDLTEKSMQPLILNDLWLICNGEIFNHKELEEKYGFNMNTGSDCEVILHLYERFGRNEAALKRLLNELQAEFAFILYDKRSQTLIVARDPFGIRPLFYSYSGRELVLASEIKALGFRQKVKPLLPGSYIFREQKGSENMTKFIKYYMITPYYKRAQLSMIEPPNYHKRPSKVIYETLRNHLEESVKLRLMSDRPVGCFLSGGLDSSLVTALAARHLPNLHCFSIGLNNGVDIQAAKKVVAFLNAKGMNLKHHIVTFTIEEGFSVIKEVIGQLETRCVTTIRAGVVNYLLAKYIKENTEIKVLYSGSGSDEVFNGYQYGKMISDAHVLEDDSIRLLEQLYLYDNLRDDRTTSAFGLEIRVPFLCKKLVDYVFSIPGTYRLSNALGSNSLGVETMEKMLLRDAFKNENILPNDILYRRKEAWSDAVSSKEVSWYKTLTSAFIEPLISDEEFADAGDIYPFDTPKTKESLYYRKIFEEFYPKRERIIPKIWMPPADIIGVKMNDPSATALDCYKQ